MKLMTTAEGSVKKAPKKIMKRQVIDQYATAGMGRVETAVHRRVREDTSSYSSRSSPKSSVPRSRSSSD